tara:strand:+ start:775 stop:1125 length:351 start_codon:yes stop_codon:yes gene_type:complete
MRRSASEIISDLETRVARLEKQSRAKVSGHLTLVTEDDQGDFHREEKYISGIRELRKAIQEYDLTRAYTERYGSDEITLSPSDGGESQGYEHINLVLSKEDIARQFMDRLGIKLTY